MSLKFSTGNHSYHLDKKACPGVTSLLGKGLPKPAIPYWAAKCVAEYVADYPDGAFDMAILSDTLQAMQRPATVLAELVRIGKRGVVSFPNFGHWRVRASLALGGRMPVTPSLPVSWHETANIHFCTVDDFRALAAELDLRVESAAFLSGGRRHGAAFANLLAEQAVFVLGR